MRIGIIGDRNDEVRAHVAIPRALELAGEGRPLSATWLATDAIGDLEPYDAFWCTPGSPYRSFGGALGAIRFAREQRRPFLGTCGGFQHALIEYARNVLGLTDADHAESSPDAPTQLVTALSCSLVGVEGRIRFRPGSAIAAIYGAGEAVEGYRCNYGLNPAYRARIEASSLRVGAVDDDGEVRAVELPGHPFFLATLFQPELSALVGREHPLVSAFVRAAAERR